MLKCANPEHNFRLRDLDHCNHFNAKRAQAVSTHRIQPLIVEQAVGLVEITTINSITSEGRWVGVTMG